MTRSNAELNKKNRLQFYTKSGKRLIQY